MKDRKRVILISLGSFIIGVIIGAIVLFYITRDFSSRYLLYTMAGVTRYHTMQNTRVLTYIKNSEKDKAIDALESDLDLNILTLDSLRTNNNLASAEEREDILERLKSIKRYRIQYPRSDNSAVRNKMAEEVLSLINLDQK